MLKRLYITLILMLIVAITAHSQEARTEITVDFRVNSVTIEPDYSNNAVQLQEIVDFMRAISSDTTIKVTEISFCGAASPEGSYQLNHRLARGRLEALERVVRSEVEMPDSIITRDDSYISWDFLRQQVEASDMPQRQQVLDIIDQEPYLIDYPGDRHIDHRIITLQKLDNGRVWRRIYTLYFERMRNACVVFVTYKQKPKPGPVVFPPISVEVNPVMPLVADSVATTVDQWVRYLHVKSNVIGLGLSIANAGVEIDLAKHWSFALPVYYSAWDYFKETTNFRTLAIQPEFRYWPHSRNDGFFVGAHFGMAYFNIAAEGDYRYQDHNGENPALGGGISIGYRLPLSKDRRWRVEFTAGAGVYDVYYDKYLNTSQTEHGLLIETVKQRYIGLDNFAVSFSYSFGLSKKGGKR